jgi:hypothetical protein
VDGTLPRFSGTGGKTLTTSGIAVDGSNNISGIGTLASGAHVITSSSLSALAVGQSGVTNPVLKIDASTASQNDGVSITGGSSSAGSTIQAISPSSNSALGVRSKGNGGVYLATPNGSTAGIDLRPGDSSHLSVNTTTITATGNFVLATAGNEFKIKEGTNAAMGRATLVAGSATVSNTLVTANSHIFLSNDEPSGSIGALSVSARTAGTSFTITSTNAGDTSGISWLIVEPAP